jgi:hypothetical protein
MEIHCLPVSVSLGGRGLGFTYNDVVTTGFSQHVGDQLGRNGSPRLIFLVLTGVGEVGEDSSDSASGRNLESAW